MYFRDTDYVQDIEVYETLRKIYINTESETVRHVVENAMVFLLRGGVKPCQR